jgi:DNA-binding CsgD family transcriptional regulator/PAS domain-containing protein
VREPSGQEALVFSLYDAALDPRQWGPIATQLARVLKAGSAAIQVRTAAQVHILSRSANFSDGDAEAYRSYYHARDVLVPRAAARGMNQVQTSAELIPESEWTETEIYKDYFTPLGIHHIVGGMMTLPQNAVGVFSVHRDRRSKPFSAEDKANLTRLMPHVRNAIRIQQSLQTSSLEHAAARTFLERSTTALLVVDRAGRLLLASPKGEELLERSLALTVIAGRVVAAQMSAQHRLLGLIEAAVDTAAGRGEAAGGTLAIPVEHQPPLAVTVSPLRPQRDGIGLPEPAALILVRDPAERVDITQLAFELFGLTRSEALLANGLANGLTIHEVALAHGVTLNTIRTQLKSVLTKTATSRQTELVSLLFRSRAGQI